MGDPATTAALAEDLREAVGGFVRAARDHDQLGAARAGALGHLARSAGGLSIAELAAREHVRHQSMARLVKALERHGWVSAGADPTDARRVALTITEEGRAALRHDRERRAAWIAEAITTRLTDTERAALAELPRLLRALSG